MIDTFHCSHCEQEKPLTLTLGYYTKRNYNKVCFECVGYLEAVAATEEGARIRWRYKTSEPKKDLKPVNPNPIGLIEFDEYQKELKRLEAQADEILAIAEKN